MSVIACRVTPDAIVVAADSLITNGCMRRSRIDAKLFVEKGMIIGAAGDLEIAQLFRYFIRNMEIEWEYTEGGVDIRDELFASYTAFVMHMDNLGMNLRHEDDEPYNEFMIIAKGRAFFMHGYDIREVSDYDAIGCGGMQAVPLLEMGISPVKTVAAVIKYNIHCGFPIVQYEYDKDTEQHDLTIYREGDTLP